MTSLYVADRTWAGYFMSWSASLHIIRSKFEGKYWGQQKKKKKIKSHEQHSTIIITAVIMENPRMILSSVCEGHQAVTKQIISKKSVAHSMALVWTVGQIY